MKKIAYFDFDGTLTKQDSLWEYLKLSIPKWRLYHCIMLRAFYAFFLRMIKRPFDAKTYIKSHLLLLLTGQSDDEIQHIASALASKLNWKQPIIDRLYALHDTGYEIVIISGGLDIYLPSLLTELPINHIYCTKMAKQNGQLLGYIEGKNCVRQQKPVMIKQYQAEKQ